MLKRDVQSSPVEVQHGVEEALAGPVEPTVALAGFVAEQNGAHHRCGRQRDRERDHDRNRDRHRKLAEQAADDAAHQQDRNEDGDERDAHRQHGEADFVGSLECRFQRGHPVLDVAGDVFENDDGIIDDEPGRDRERHQREIVEAVAHQIHDGECRDQRNRHRHDRYQRRAQVSQEGKNHDDHQQHGKDQGSFDIAQRCANGRRAVDCQFDVNGR